MKHFVALEVARFFQGLKQYMSGYLKCEYPGVLDSIRINRKEFHDRYASAIYKRIGQKYLADDLEYFMIYNFHERTDIEWIGDLDNKESHGIYLEYKGRREALAYRFEQDLQVIVDSMVATSPRMSKIDETLVGTPPLMWTMYDKHHAVCPETLCILNGLTDGKLWQLFDQRVKYDRKANPYNKLKRYAAFVTYDREKFMGILKNYVSR